MSEREGNSGRFGEVCPIVGCNARLNHRDGESLVCEGRKHWVVDLEADDG